MIVAVGYIQVAGSVRGHSAGMIQKRYGGRPAISARRICSAGRQRNPSEERNALHNTGGTFREVQA